MREKFEKAIAARFADHREKHHCERKGKKGTGTRCSLCDGSGIPCGCGAGSKTAVPCHACGGRGHFLGASLLCPQCQGAPLNADGTLCTTCEGTGSVADRLVYTENGRQYPFSTREVFKRILDDGTIELRVTGYVDIPGQPIRHRRTRSNLLLVDVVTEGCVSPSAPGSESIREPAAPAAVADPADTVPVPKPKRRGRTD